MSSETKVNIEEETIIAMLAMRASALGEKRCQGRTFLRNRGFCRVFASAAARLSRQGRGRPTGVVQYLGRSDRWRCLRCQANGRRRRCFLEWSDAHDGN